MESATNICYFFASLLLPSLRRGEEVEVGVEVEVVAVVAEVEAMVVALVLHLRRKMKRVYNFLKTAPRIIALI